MLLIKKWLSAFLLPLPISLTLLASGLALLFIHKARKFAFGLIMCSVILLLLFSTPWLPNLLLTHLENKYPPLVFVPPYITNIVVLGSGSWGNSTLPANVRLNSASLARLTEAIRIHRLLPNSQLVLSGGRAFGSAIDANIINNAAVALGVKPDQLVMVAGSQNTYEEVLNIQKNVKNGSFILVTSAAHMTRAMVLFQKQGMHPIPAPTQFIIQSHHSPIKKYFPNSINLIHSDIALHEYLGLAWAYLTGKS